LPLGVSSPFRLHEEILQHTYQNMNSKLLLISAVFGISQIANAIPKDDNVPAANRREKSSYIKFVESTKAKAKKNDPDALGIMAYLILTKWIHEDYNQGVEYAKKSASLGSFYGDFSLGLHFEFQSKGDDKFRKLADEKYNKCIKPLMRQAKLGKAVAQNCLGSCYDYGRGVDKRPLRAFEWYQKAADQGFAVGQLNVGICYEKGIGVVRDQKKGFEWTAKAAEQQMAAAQSNLGGYFQQGIGTEKNFEKAFELYSKAAEQGLSLAQFNLGLCYYEGKGVRQDLAKSFEWHMKAANQGYIFSQINLGIAYAEGKGVKEDQAKAFQ
jgi:uncharacterized protein